MDPVKRILGKDIWSGEYGILGWTKSGAAVKVESSNMNRSNAYFVYGKKGSEGKQISFNNARKVIVKFTDYGRSWYDNPPLIDM